MLILVPSPASLGYHPDSMELEALASLLRDGSPLRAHFSDAQGRQRTAAGLSGLGALSGVLVLEAGSAKLVVSDALFAFADAACPCGESALVDVHEVYKRTHGGAAPARLLRAFGLGRALRGRCKKCGAPLAPARVRARVEAPFAHLAAFSVDGARLQKITAFEWRSVPRG